MWDSSTLRLLVGSQSELVLFIRGDGYRSVYVPCLMRSASYLFCPLCFLFTVLIVFSIDLFDLGTLFISVLTIYYLYSHKLKDSVCKSTLSNLRANIHCSVIRGQIVTYAGTYDLRSNLDDRIALVTLAANPAKGKYQSACCSWT